MPPLRRGSKEKIGPAGDYDRLFVWYVHGTTHDPGYGQPIPIYTPRQTVYGFIKDETFYNPSPQGSQSRATIHLRGLLPISASDRLLDAMTGYIWKIAGLRQNVRKNETIYEAFR